MVQSNLWKAKTMKNKQYIIDRIEKLKLIIKQAKQELDNSAMSRAFIDSLKLEMNTLKGCLERI